MSKVNNRNREEAAAKEARRQLDDDYKSDLVKVIPNARQRYLRVIEEAMEATRPVICGEESWEIPDHKIRLSAANMLIELCGDKKTQEINININIAERIKNARERVSSSRK